MAKIQITIDTGNAAFEEFGEGNEFARILRVLSYEAEYKVKITDMDNTKLMDANGNTVGEIKAIQD